MPGRWWWGEDVRSFCREQKREGETKRAKEQGREEEGQGNRASERASGREGAKGGRGEEEGRGGRRQAKRGTDGGRKCAHTRAGRDAEREIFVHSLVQSLDDLSSPSPPPLRIP